MLCPNTFTLLPFCIYYAFYHGCIHADACLIPIPLRRRSAAHTSVFIHLYGMGTGANDPSCPLQVGIRSKGPLLKNLLVIWVILSASPLFSSLLSLQKVSENSKQSPATCWPSLTTDANRATTSTQHKFDTEVFFKMTAHLTCLFWKNHARSPQR